MQQVGVGTPMELVFVCGAGLAPRDGQCGAKMGGGEKQKEEAGRGANPLPLCRAPLQAGSPSLSPNRCLVLSSPFTFLLTFPPFLLPPHPRFSQLSPGSVQQLRQEAKNLHSNTHPTPAPPLDTHGYMCLEFPAAAEAVSGATELRSPIQFPGKHSTPPTALTPGILYFQTLLLLVSSQAPYKDFILTRGHPTTDRIIMFTSHHMVFVFSAGLLTAELRQDQTGSCVFYLLGHLALSSSHD